MGPGVFLCSCGEFLPFNLRFVVRDFVGSPCTFLISTGFTGRFFFFDIGFLLSPCLMTFLLLPGSLVVVFVDIETSAKVPSPLLGGIFRSSITSPNCCCFSSLRPMDSLSLELNLDCVSVVCCIEGFLRTVLTLGSA